ncbi:MAG: flagellar hook-associated protein FlgK [Solirubrobacteraceae bacterium]|nr:flagellar hook-associated protein FlgK [Solirubrobacteraceae bacterium]
MQVSSFFGLQTALRGITAQQRALDVTSNNVANAGTEGYSRQEVAYSASSALKIQSGLASGAGAYLGQGVEIEQFRRMRDSFLDIQYRAQNTTAGYDTTNAEGVRRALDEFNEPGDEGLNALLEKFWTSWTNLSNSPSDLSVKSAVIGHATTLANALNNLDSRLATAQNYAGTEYTALTTGAQNPIGPIATELAKLNTQIKAATSIGQSPNDLLDRRDLLLDRLSEYGNVSTTDLGNGALQVTFGDAANPLVDDAAVDWPQALTAPGGKLEALLNTQTTIASYRADLDAFASSLITGVNAAHTADGAPNFFSGTTAATIGVNATTATIDSGTGTTTGANDIARAISALANGTADNLYATLVARVGHDTSVAESSASSSDSLLSTIQNRKLSVAGVSLDEEMANMIRFQRGYQASARTMSTMDEMLDVLINRTGRVGL